jgi:SAM-dependent methyltransferase
MTGKLDLDAIRAFTSQLAPGARILVAGCGTGLDLAYFARLGFKAEGFDPSEENVQTARKNSGCEVWRADPMLLSLARETYDGIWAHGTLIPLPPHGCQRVMGSFFAALKPGGILFVSTEGSYTRDEFASLVRQSGFGILIEGSEAANPKRFAFVARRV